MSESLIKAHSPESFSIKIEQFNINPTHVLDFEMSYSLESVIPKGYITIADAINMEAQMFQNGDKTLVLKMKDALKQEYKMTCKIIGGEQVRSGGKNVILKLELEEQQSLDLSNLFWGKGYKITTIQSLLKEYLNKIKGDKSLDLTAPNILENFAVPVNKPFLQTIEYFRNKYKLYIFRTKKKFVAKDMNFILSGSLLDRSEEIKYALRPPNHFYYNTIKDINALKTNRTKVNTALPDSRTFVSDLKKKEIKKYDYSFKESLGEIPTTGGGEEQANFSAGFFRKTLMRDKEYKITTKGYHFREIQDLKGVEIAVSSNLDLDIGTKVTLDLDIGNGAFGKKELEKYYKGKWVIYSLTEKINKGMPLQKLVLIKPKL